MKIYTYYEDIKFDGQEPLLELWNQSWKQSGFEPIVLSRDDAQKSCYYTEFVEKIQNIHWLIMNKEISSYGLSCYLRWLAYSVQQDEYFYVSDYDCINNGLSPVITTAKLHLMDYVCPCFVSGKPDQFKNLCHLFIDMSIARITEIKSLKLQFHYHDQEFFAANMTHTYNKNLRDILDSNNIMITRDTTNGVGPFELTKINTVKVLHISHNNIKNIKKQYPQYKDMSINQIRILLMEKALHDRNT